MIMLVSIVMPTFNRSELVYDSIQSVICQSYSNWELIIVDDGSSTEEVNKIKKFSFKKENIFFYKRPDKLVKGANSCRNYGLSKSKGELIKWMDSDDLLTEDALQKQVSIFMVKKDVKICLGYGAFYYPDDNNKLEYWSRNNTSNNIFSDHLVNKIRWPIGGILWNKSHFETDPFLPKLSNSQEWLMHSLQLTKTKFDEIYNLKDIVYLIRRGHNRISSEKSSKYYYNQFKARYVLFIEAKNLSYNDSFQLLKQLIIYLFYTILFFIKK